MDVNSMTSKFAVVPLIFESSFLLESIHSSLLVAPPHITTSNPQDPSLFFPSILALKSRINAFASSTSTPS